MSEIALFTVGCILFIATTWATFAFGLSRIHELALEDIAEGDRYPADRGSGLTDIYVTGHGPAEGSEPGKRGG